VDRNGAETGRLGDDADYGDITLSPDGIRVAVTIREQGSSGADIWTIDIASGRRTRVTSDPADDIVPVWLADGRILFSSDRAGSYDVCETAADGSGGDTAVVTGPGDQLAYDWDAERRYVLYQSNQPRSAGANMDLWARSLPGGRAFAYLRTVHAASRPSFSPDGRWVLYTSLENGEENVYVARFPHYNGRKRVSPRGGSWARWRGDNIYYVDADDRLMVVPVTGAAAGVQTGPPMPAYPMPVKPGRGYGYDVSVDGQRVLVNVPR
jgi:Tol biopolymer transport system component